MKGTLGILAFVTLVAEGFAVPAGLIPEQGSPESNELRNQRRNLSIPVGGGHFLNTTNGTLLARSQNVTTTACSPLSPCDDAIRDKKMRLQNIQEYVLSTLGRGKVPNKPVGSPINGTPTPQATSFSGEIKVLQPSCETPVRVDPNVWNDPAYFHVYFPLASLHSSNGTNGKNGSKTVKKGLTTISAKLRLFKIATGDVETEGAWSLTIMNNTQSNNASDTTVKVFVEGKAVPTTELPLVEEKIRVSIFWYKSPITRTHYRKKLLDTKMISIKESKWVEFDIINAAAPWLDRDDRNFGLAVEVENEDNERVDPANYFAHVACSEGNTTVRQASLVTAPQLEICVLSTGLTQQRQVPVTEAPVHFPIQMENSFNLLSRIAKSHQQQRQNPTSNPTESAHDWQNDYELAVSTTSEPKVGRHRHRHGHGQMSSTKAPRNPAPVQGSSATGSEFKLGDDHPLRRIFAAAATSINKASSRSGSESSFESGSDEDDKDVIIQKIYLRNPSDPIQSR